MKSIIISLLGVSSLGLLTNCTFVETPESASHSTTTTTAEVTPTVYGTLETKTTRTY